MRAGARARYRSCCRKPCEPCRGTNRARRCDSWEMHRCYLSRTTASVVLGRVQLPAAAPVLYSIGREAWQAATHLAGRVAADMTVLQNHMSKDVRANGCSQCRARAGKRECHPRQEIDCTDTSADIPASGGCLFFVLKAKRSAWAGRCVLLEEIPVQWHLLGWLVCCVEPHLGHIWRPIATGLKLMEGESRWLTVHLAMTCMLRWQCRPVETDIAGKLVTILDRQLRGVVVCGPSRLTKTWNRLVPLAAYVGSKTG
jgi:hypothetical protein